MPENMVEIILLQNILIRSRLQTTMEKHRRMKRVGVIQLIT
jgi:hypothetical protein